MTAISSTIKDTMNLFTAYLKSNPPARGAQQVNYRNSKKNADRRRKRRDRNQNQGKEGNVVVPTSNPIIPTGRGPKPTTQTMTKESNPHPHPNHTREHTLPIMNTQAEAVEQAKSEDILMEPHQQGTHIAYSRRPFTEEYTKATVAAYLQETPRWTPPEFISVIPHKMPHPEMIEEHRLLQIQDMLAEEENFVGPEGPPEIGPSTNELMRETVQSTLVDTPYESSSDDLLLMHLGQKQIAPILVMSCSCSTVGKTSCWHFKM